jgi:hypothetical protein
MVYENLDHTFTWQEQRSLSTALTLQYDKVLYLVDPIRENQRLAGKRVTVIDYPDGRIKIKYEGRELGYREFDKLTQTHQGEREKQVRYASILSAFLGPTRPDFGPAAASGDRGARPSVLGWLQHVTAVNRLIRQTHYERQGDIQPRNILIV